LGNELVGPLITRGVLLDVLGWKQAHGGSDLQTINGRQMLTDYYRVTLDDLQATMAWEGIDGFEPGDVILIRTGWWWLAEDPATYDHYLNTEPGIYIREAKYLADHRPAIIGSDAWALEVVANPDLTEWAFPVHTALIPQHGIRIGEGIITDSLAEIGAHTFVYSYMPQHAWGATAGNTAPVGLTS
jgi:kynurenine formamidase